MAKPAIPKYLLCHHNNSPDGKHFTVGSKYDVFDETKTHYAVRDDDQMVKYIPTASLNYSIAIFSSEKKNAAWHHNAAFKLRLKRT